MTTGARSTNMRAIRSTGMKPEVAVRKLVYGLGYRYRLHRRDLPGSPDLVFLSRKKVIFVHGCFWHQHGSPLCTIVRQPKSNTSYWLPKLNQNVARDARNIDELRNLGWDILIIWECELSDVSKVAQRVLAFLL